MASPGAGLPALIILGPLLLPLANGLGIDSIHYAMVILLAMGIGIFVPPIGICFYIACAVAEAEVEAAARTMLPYLAVLILGVLTVAFVPWLTHVVPDLSAGADPLTAHVAPSIVRGGAASHLGA